MEPIQIVRKTQRLIVPEPKQLWAVSPLERVALIKIAKGEWVNFRSDYGFGIPNNLSEVVFGSVPNSNQKLDKSIELIFGLSLAQASLSGINVCHWSSPECRQACVGQNGNNGFKKTMAAKIAKTRFLFENPEAAGVLLADFWMKADSKIDLGHEVGGRPNTFSDINWIEAAPWMFERFPRINFYDYAADFNRVSPFSNYHLTYSAKERHTDEEIVQMLEQGRNVAIVFSPWGKKPLPDDYLGFPVINGDLDDVRWKDPSGVIVGLHRKGKMRVDSPMVHRV